MTKKEHTGKCGIAPPEEIWPGQWETGKATPGHREFKKVLGLPFYSGWKNLGEMPSSD